MKIRGLVFFLAGTAEIKTCPLVIFKDSNKDYRILWDIFVCTFQMDEFLYVWPDS